MSAGPESLIAEPLSAAAFAPFGQVLALPDRPGRIDYSPGLENLRPEARPCFRTGLVAPAALPLQARVMERHRFSSQAFLPLDVSRYLVLVAPDGADGRPDPGGLRAFIAGPRQGINYAAGTWHHPMTPLDRPGLFATVMWLDGSAGDEQFVDLVHPVKILEN